MTVQIQDTTSACVLTIVVNLSLVRGEIWVESCSNSKLSAVGTEYIASLQAMSLS